MKKLIVFFVFITILGGCGSTFKRGVVIWCRNEIPFFTGFVAEVYESDDEESRELMNIAGLPCLLDVENGKANPENPTPACRCAWARDESERTSACQKWLEETKEKGGCYE